MSERDTLPVYAGALIGHRRNGQPIYLAAGGSEDVGDGGGDAPIDDSASGDDIGEDTTDWKAEAERHKADADRWKKHSRKNETALRELQQRTKAAPASGSTEETATVNGSDDRVASAEARANAAETKLRIHGLATELGADPKALLDSVSFLDQVENLADDLDPGDWDAFDAKVTELIKKRGGKKTPGTARSGGEFAGGSNAGQPITEEQLSRMSPEDIAKALSQGKLSHLL